jgi:hypothetical protein
MEASLSNHEQERVRRAFQTLSGREAMLLWNVLAAHVENERCNDSVEHPEASPAFQLAEGILERVERALVDGI